MTTRILSFIFFPLLLMTACTQEEDLLQMTDADLISAIQQADKQQVDPSALPDGATITIARDFSGNYNDRTLLATELGYEVRLRGERGSRMGEPTDLYFSLDGRRLGADGNHGGRGRKGGPKGPQSDQKLQDCFELVFPVSFTMPDGTTVTGESGPELRQAIKAWYIAHPDVKEGPALQFPVDVILEDGTEVTVSTKEELEVLRQECVPGPKGGMKKRCFKLVFPVTHIMPDGSTITSENRMEMRQALHAWHEANPDVKERGQLQYPVEVILKDGTTKSVASSEEMIELKKECGPKGPMQGAGKPCFELVFPVTHLMPDGTTITSTSKEEMRDALKAWHQANPDVKERGQLQFPVEIVFDDGTTQTIDSAEELKAAREDCE